MLNSVTYNFHVSIYSRNKFSFDENLFSITGDLIVANFKVARDLSQKINQKRAEEKSDLFTTAGQINALGLLHEIFHFVIRHYEEKENPGVFERSIFHFKKNIGEDNLESLLLSYVNQFPPLPVYKKEISASEYLQKNTAGKSNKEIIIEELILLHLENINYPFRALKELFNDEDLNTKTVYKNFLAEADKFFKTEKPLSLEGLPLIEALKKPILTNINSIDGQLNYLKTKWKIILDDKFLTRLLSGTDLIKEDAKLFIQHGATGTPPVPEYKILTKEEIEKLKQEKSGYSKTDYHYEYEHFTADTAWMPNVVMIAKNTFVWLDQLSKNYQREIKRLDQIPDEELDKLQKWNFTALWLIGLWERSFASKKIKQFCGNPDATASAYSLFDYEISHELGGEDAFQNLKYRCAIRGIRLASDMVPNHTGIFSRWILDNPDFFIQTTYPPFPVYSFTGPDLSDDSRYQIRIEDRYYTRQDAAVVFQLVENNTGRIRYIYHGNDGTNMPWNDTAQLNLLREDVRESLIQKILHVARKTSIIRFDAAMTLTKLHYSRLWFPAPGLGGAIPSRSDFSIPAEEFNRNMPKEFWREVVDRINSELPNTLLLAEAFWLLEGYFVRTLGMHRVYNSAFMHMFMKEENDKYRKLIKNTIEFNPEILKRYVNFMSNPDEETAINQFGKGDKYFGIAVMMVTLPGLPMFAHGQIEGFTEKYGMEYQRAYYNEFVDEYLVKRHEEEVFPLLQKRYLFSQVNDFELYDFINDDGYLNENVFAFSNMFNEEKVFVIYNNSYEQTKGRVKFTSGKVASYDKYGQPLEIKNKTLSDALRLKHNDDHYYIFREHKSKLEYIRKAKKIFDDGLWFNLNGYQYNVFLDFREVFDRDGKYSRIYKFLDGKGVPSIDEAIRELDLMPLHESVTELFNRNIINELKLFAGFDSTETTTNELSNYSKSKLISVISELKSYNKVSLIEDEIISKVVEDLKTIKDLHLFINKLSKDKLTKVKDQIKSRLIFNDPVKGETYKDIFIIYLVIRRLLIALQFATNGNATKFYDSLLLHKPIWQSLLRLGDDYSLMKLEYDLLKVLASSEGIFPSRKFTLSILNGKTKEKSVSSISESHPVNVFLKHPDVRSFIGYNVYNNIEYYSKENFELLLNWNLTFELIRRTEHILRQRTKKFSADKTKEKIFHNTVEALLNYIEGIIKLSNETNFHFDELVNGWYGVKNDSKIVPV